MVRNIDRFLLATIVIDVLLLSVSGLVVPPLSPRVYGVVVLLVVSPLLAYLVVYQLFS